jgi:hypothetical protein
MRKTKVKKNKFSRKNKTKHCKKGEITDEVIRIRCLIKKLQTKKNNVTKRKDLTTRRTKST